MIGCDSHVTRMFTCVGSATCRFVVCSVDLSRRFSTLSFWSSGPNLHHVREDRGRYSICFDYHSGFHGGFSCFPDVDAARRFLQALKCRGHRRWGDGEGPTGCQYCRLWSRNPARTLFPLLSKIPWYQGDPKLAETDCMCALSSPRLSRHKLHNDRSCLACNFLPNSVGCFDVFLA